MAPATDNAAIANTVTVVAWNGEYMPQLTKLLVNHSNITMISIRDGAAEVCSKTNQYACPTVNAMLDCRIVFDIHLTVFEGLARCTACPNTANGGTP
jgi:hypothetical protein